MKYLLIILFVAACSILRIITLPVHVDLPRPPSHQHGYYDYEGVIHWHTRYSGDALGTYEQAAALGNLYHLDFLISTEHNNLLALKDHKEGWHGRMLTLVGVESSRREGYLLGLNLHTYTTRYSSTDTFLSEVKQQGGFAIIAHPMNPRWRWRGAIDPRMAGQEIMDLTDQFTTASPLSILTAVLYYPLNTPAAYLEIYHRPTETLAMWDKITSYRSFTGIYAPDAHQSIKIFWGRRLHFPKADDLIPIAHDHVILPAAFTGDFLRDKAMLYGAIERGRVYVAMDELQDATGFFFAARQGDKIAWMGDPLRAGIKTEFFVTLPRQLELKNITVTIYHNGEKFAVSRGPADYAFQTSLAGAYRVEVECDVPTFWGLPKRIVWIYSNPIYLR